MKWFTKKRIYLDYAAATPVRREVRLGMEPHWSTYFGNAGAVHQEGQLASSEIEKARHTLARVLHARAEGVVFTASGTESNNLALLGVLQKLHDQGRSYGSMEVITTGIEHPSILETLSFASSLGVRVITVPVNQEGQIETASFEQAITAQTVLVTFAYANSEIGVVQNVGKLVRCVRAKEKKLGTRIYVHLDAAQAPLWLPCELNRLGVDLLSLDAGKCYGPKGVGVLVFAHGVALSPIMHGGSQEGGLRAGTENTPLIVGATIAIAYAQEHMVERSARVRSLRDAFIEDLCTIKGVELNGSVSNRLPNNVNISIPGVDPEFAVVSLDHAGIACSTKSACGTAKGNGSHVVRALGLGEDRVLSTLRFTLGEETTRAELRVTATVLKDHIVRMRQFASSLTHSADRSQ